MEILRTALAISLLLFCAVAAPTAQNKAHVEAINASDNNCESNKAYFDYIDINTPENELIIIIARLGNGETSRMYNRRRLHNIRTYLNRIREIPNQRIITAEGEQVRGRGRIEVYSGGRLMIVFTVGRNQDLAGGDCEQVPSSLYYPMRRRAR